MPWYYAVAEREHDLQNPTSPEKIVRLGELLRLGPGTRVLDVACGACGPAIRLAATFGCSILGVERSPEFVARARERVAAAGLGGRIEVVEMDAAGFEVDPAAWDVALCLGATFVYGGLEQTLARFAGIERIAVGEPFPRAEGPAAIAERFLAAGWAPVGIVAASDDDWDRYVSLQWRALEEWLREHDDPEIRARHEEDRRRYLETERRELGWAIVAGLRL